MFVAAMRLKSRQLQLKLGYKHNPLCTDVVGYEVFWAQTRFELTPILHDNFQSFGIRLEKVMGEIRTHDLIGKTLQLL